MSLDAPRSDAELLASDTRRCSHCRGHFPSTLEWFPPSTVTASRLGSWCRVCVRGANRRYKRANAASELARNRAYRAAHRDEVRGWKRNEYQRDAEAIKEKRRAYRRSTPGYWRLTTEQYREKSALRRVRKGRGGPSFTAADVRRLYHRQRAICATCTASLAVAGYHVDHVIPLARGGSNGVGNIQLTCPSCNVTKGRMLPVEFRRYLSKRAAA